MKKRGVTLILRYFGPCGSGFSFAAKVDIATTTDVMKVVPPSKTQMDFAASIVFSLAAAIPENTSGAPFPKANNVTPASESLSLKVTVMVSKAGVK
jgi:hypothetical protein